MILGIVASSIAKETAITNYVFDGDSDAYMADEATTPTLLDSIVNQTWVIRVKRTSLSTQHGILGATTSTGAVKLEVDANDDNMDASLNDDAVAALVNGNCSDDLGWHIYSLTYDQTSIDLWQDGVEIKTSTTADFSSRTSGHALAVGAAVIGGTTPGLLVGEISDVQFYNRLLTDTEIGDLHTDLTDLPTDHATSLRANFAGDKTSTTWTSEVGGFALTNQGGVTTN